MSSREAVRTAIVVGGIWLIFSALGSQISSLAIMVESVARGDPASDRLLWLLFWAQLPVAAGVLLLGIAPGLYSILSSRRWARRLCPGSDQIVEVGPSLLLAVGSMLLGLSIGVSGAISFVSFGGAFLLRPLLGDAGVELESYELRILLSGLSGVVAGILLFRWGSNGVLRAA